MAAGMRRAKNERRALGARRQHVKWWKKGRWHAMRVDDMHLRLLPLADVRSEIGFQVITLPTHVVEVHERLQPVRRVRV